MEPENSQKAGRRRSSRGVKRGSLRLALFGKACNWTFLLWSLKSLRLTSRKAGSQSGQWSGPQEVLCIAASNSYPVFCWGTASYVFVWYVCVDTRVWRGQRTTSMMFLGLHSSVLFFKGLSL